MVVEQVEEAEATAMLVVQNWYEESATASRAKSQEKKLHSTCCAHTRWDIPFALTIRDLRLLTHSNKAT